MENLEEEVARRVAAVNVRYIQNPGLKEGVSVLAETRRKRRQNGKALVSLVTGRSGVGKTRLFERYLASQPEAPEDTTPVLMLTVPPNADEAKLFSAILRSLGEPVLEHQKAAQVIERATFSLQRHRVELLLLEEASHIVDKKANDAKIPYRVTDAIKTYLLDGAYPVPVVMNGIPVARAIFEINPQMETRRHRTVELKPYGFSDEASKEMFQTLLEALEAEAGFRRPFLTKGSEAVSRVHRATDGLHGKVAKLLCDATELAVRKGADGFDIEILAEAFARISDPGPDWTNWFLVETRPVAREPDETRTTKLHKREKHR